MKNLETAEQFTESRLDYFESEDFKNNYAEYLLEDTQQANTNIIKVITENYAYKESDLSAYVLDELRELIYNDNDYLSTFNGYYVGSYCIDSISFGEQSEEIPKHLQNPEAKEILEKEFYVNDEITYCYRDMSAEGVYLFIGEGDQNIINCIEEAIKEEAEEAERQRRHQEAKKAREEEEKRVYNETMYPEDNK